MPAEPSSPDRRHFAQSIVDLLHEKFDPEAKQLITSYEPENSQMFVDEDRLSALHLTSRDLAHFLESQPFIFAVFTTTTRGVRLTRRSDAARPRSGSNWRTSGSTNVFAHRGVVTWLPAVLQGDKDRGIALYLFCT